MNDLHVFTHSKAWLSLILLFVTIGNNSKEPPTLNQDPVLGFVKGSLTQEMVMRNDSLKHILLTCIRAISNSAVMDTCKKRDIMNNGRDPNPWVFLYTLPTRNKMTWGMSSLHLLPVGP